MAELYVVLWSFRWAHGTGAPTKPNVFVGSGLVDSGWVWYSLVGSCGAWVAGLGRACGRLVGSCRVLVLELWLASR